MNNLFKLAFRKDYMMVLWNIHSGFEFNVSRFANRDALFAMQKSTKINKIAMQVLYAYFPHMLHEYVTRMLCILPYCSRMLRILLVAYNVCILRVCCAYSSRVFFAYVTHHPCVWYAYSSHMLRIILAYDIRILRACCAYSSHMLRIILAYDMRTLRICYASSLCMICVLFVYVVRIFVYVTRVLRACYAYLT